jgi:surfactin synthase thioesterase subunit
MEEILGLLGFSLGASLGIGAVRSVTDSSRPIVRELFKVGIRAWDAVASAAPTAREEAATTRRGGRRRAQPEKIIIAHQ